MEFSEIQSKLLATDVSSKIEKKGMLSYLSWAYAWAEVIKIDPTASYEIEKFDNLPFIKTEEGYIVYTKVTIGGVTREMWLPVMDSKNKALTTANMFDINKAIMRCLVKNIAMFGLGISVYVGEDTPQNIVDETPTVEPKKKIICTHCGKEVKAYGKLSAEDFAKGTYKTYGEILCLECANRAKAEKNSSEQSNN